jgi:hypothetical protein
MVGAKEAEEEHGSTEQKQRPKLAASFLLS